MAGATKRKSNEYPDDEGFVANDSDGSDRPRKRSKNATSSTKSQNVASAGKPQVDDNGDSYWELSKMRRVTVSEFKGKRMVNIREYYEQNGKTLPGKKGISLPMDQYSAFIALLPLVEAELRKEGENVPRPRYDTTGSSDDADNGDSEEVEDGSLETKSKSNGVSKKSNIEATSDEDEGE